MRFFSAKYPMPAENSAPGSVRAAAALSERYLPYPRSIGRLLPRLFRT